jgi:hypothetical protein
MHIRSESFEAWPKIRKARRMRTTALQALFFVLLASAPVADGAVPHGQNKGGETYSEALGGEHPGERALLSSPANQTLRRMAVNTL